MLTQFLHYRIYIIFYFLLNISILQSGYISDWGNFSIKNQSLKVQNEDIINVMNNHIVYMNSKFGNIKKEPFTIIISNKDNHLSNNNTWNWSLGITRNNTIIIKDISKSHISKSKLMEVLKHELNHLYLNRLNASLEIPRWFEEGFAMYYANENSLSNKLIIANNIKNSDIFNMEILNKRFNSNSKKQFNFAYAYSQILFEDIIQNYSEEVLTQIILDIRFGESFDKVFYNNILLTPNDYNKEMLLKITSKFWWLRFMKFPSLLLILAPLLSIIGFIIVKIKNQKVIKKWDIEEELDKENEI